MVTHLAWMAHRFICSRSPTRNASPASCKANTAKLCNFNPSLLFCTISLTSLWKGTFLIRRSAPFWYFWISFRACIPLCIFLCFSNFSSLIVFNCLFFLSLIHFALSLFSFLAFSIFPFPCLQLPVPFLSLLFPSIPLLSLPSLIMEGGLNLFHIG